MHQFRRAIHNLKKFFAFRRRKYTLVVYKDLSANILLSKKENIIIWDKKSPRLNRREVRIFKSPRTYQLLSASLVFGLSAGFWSGVTGFGAGLLWGDVVFGAGCPLLGLWFVTGRPVVCVWFTEEGCVAALLWAGCTLDWDWLDLLPFKLGFAVWFDWAGWWFVFGFWLTGLTLFAGLLLFSWLFSGLCVTGLELFACWLFSGFCIAGLLLYAGWLFDDWLPVGFCVSGLLLFAGCKSLFDWV